MLENRSAQHQEVVDKFIDPVVSYSMSSTDYVVRPSASAAIIMTLPSVADAKGRFYSIVARLASAVNTITITDKDDSEQWADLVINATGGKVVLYSDGTSWHSVSFIADTTAAGIGADGTISSRSVNALGECYGFLVIGGKYVPYWDDIRP